MGKILFLGISLALIVLIVVIILKFILLFKSKKVNAFIVDKKIIKVKEYSKSFDTYKIYRLVLKYTYKNQEYTNIMIYEDRLKKLNFMNYLNILILKNNPMKIVNLNVLNLIVLSLIWIFLVYLFIMSIIYDGWVYI